MAIDLLIILFLIVLVVWGYSTGFMRSLGSILSAALGIWLVLRKSDALVPVVNSLLHNTPAARVMSFLFLLTLFWLVLRLARSLLTKLVDWCRLVDLDQYLGGLLGFCRGIALVWAVLAGCLTIAPSSVRLIERSNASQRILTLGERLAGTGPERQFLAALPTSDDGYRGP
jgi:uncharacterized membrane protein required for colicin V production